MIFVIIGPPTPVYLKHRPRSCSALRYCRSIKLRYLRSSSGFTEQSIIDNIDRTPHGSSATRPSNARHYAPNWSPSSQLRAPDPLARVLHRMNINCRPPPSSPLEQLYRRVKDFLHEGPQAASVKMWALLQAINRGVTVVAPEDYPPQFMYHKFAKLFPWNSCKLAATLVMLMAAHNDPESIHKAQKCFSQSLGGFPKMSLIRENPSASLSEAFHRAKRLALENAAGIVSVIGVKLIDVEMVDRAERGCLSVLSYSSFAHSFVIGVDSQGWRLFQSWGEHGYRLDEFLERTPGPQLRSWDSGEAFLQVFEVLATGHGSRTAENQNRKKKKKKKLQKKKWTDEINSAYRECFEVDIHQICNVQRLQLPMVPVYRPWVQLLVIEDVKMADVEKLEWEF